MDWKSVEAVLGVTFQNQLLLIEAFTHRSYRNEHKDWPVHSSERLEFLGDAVLELIVTDFLFHTFPEKQEGELTELRSRIVRNAALAKVAFELGFWEFVCCSRGERGGATASSRDHILSWVYEAVIGAIRLDKGYEEARFFVDRTLLCNADELMKKEVDFKSLLQARSQEILRITPNYKVLQQSGAEHAKRFIVGVFFGDTLIAKGHGSSKKLAEEKAAEAGMILRGWKVAR